MSVTSFMFYTYSKLQGSQTIFYIEPSVSKVLHLFETTRFSNNAVAVSDAEYVLHLFETTRFSNNKTVIKFPEKVLHLFETTRFSN